MAPMDPQQLLKALNPLLGPTGAILGPTEASRIASLMKDATKLVSKCIYINILKIETQPETMEKFLGVGWDTLNDWLQDAKEDENYPFLIEILKVYQLLPVSVDILKKNSAAKTIKQLCKAEHESVKTLAYNIFDEWMKKVKGNNNNNDDANSSKKKKKEKEKSRDKESDLKEEKSDKKAEKDSDRKSDSRDKSKSRDSKSSHHHSSSHHSSKSSSSSHRDREREREKEKKSETSERTRDKSEESETGSAKSDKSSDDVVSVRKREGLKLTIKIGGEKDTSPNKGEVIKKRASTVKRPPSKFRSTGLEEQSLPSKISKPSTDVDASKAIPKRTGSDMKSDLPLKRSRLNMPPPLSVPMTTPPTTPTLNAPMSPSELHGKIKIIPARPRPSNHEIHESSGFMDALDTSKRTYGAFKKKRKLSGAVAPGGPAAGGNGKGPLTPTTPPSPVSPTTVMARSLPSVPSFYKDTLQESEPSPDKIEMPELKRERSPSPTDVAEISDADLKTETGEVAEGNDPAELSPNPYIKTEGEESKETKGLLTTGATKKKKKKKSVSWKDDSEIREIFYFEMDETERENVNRPKDFNQAKKQEMMMDRRAMDTVRRFINDSMVEQQAWYRPKMVHGYKPIDFGKDSVEKSVQRLREQGVLQALFFNRNMLPDTPQEPDAEHEEPKEIKLIPMEDVSGGDEFLYNYDHHASVVANQPPLPKSHSSQHQQPPPPMGSMPPVGHPDGPGPGYQGPPPPLNLPPGSLPPDVMNLLNQLQHNGNPNDPVLGQLHQILNNLMSGNTDQTAQLQQIQHIMNSQMGLPPDMMQGGPPPGMGPGPMGPGPGQMMQGPPQGPPMGPRTGLLGTAPPGFLPQRPMGPPSRFGPPGPGGPGGPGGPPGNWGQNNMGGGGPNYNNRMRGPRPSRGGRGGGGGGGNVGGRRNVLCRHFANGSCRMGSECGFLHPGINGPMHQNGENMGT